MDDFKRPYASEELVAVAERVHGTAREKGWWPNTAEGKVVFEDGELEDKLVLIVSELIEAFEEYRNPGHDLKQVYLHLVLGWAPWTDDHTTMVPMPKPEGFPIEAADAYIRVLDLMVAKFGVAASAFLLIIEAPEVDFIASHEQRGPKVGKHVFRMIRQVALAQGDLGNALSRILLSVEVMCHDLGVDLRRAIELKAAYNDTRPFRHGNKRA